MPTSAHAACTDFTEISGECATAPRADVGIGPYRVPCKSAAARRRSPHRRIRKSPDESVCTPKSVCRGRCLHRPTRHAPILRKSPANAQLPHGPMWASAPTSPRPKFSRPPRAKPLACGGQMWYDTKKWARMPPAGRRSLRPARSIEKIQWRSHFQHRSVSTTRNKQ